MTRASCVAALCVSAALAGPQDVPVFPSEIEVVRVDVSVLRDGRVVEGLRAEEFDLRDNGVRQAVEVVGDPRGLGSGAGKPVDLVLALDVSDSVAGEPLTQLKAAAHALVDILHPGDSLSLLTFSSRVRLAATPDDSRKRAHEVIEATQARLSTSLYDAAFAAVMAADATRGRPLVLILSDGEDHGSWLDPDHVLRVAEGTEPVVHVVLTRPSGREPTFLGELAATTGGEVWRADHGRLRETLLRALEEFRARYTLKYERQGVARAGWHELDIRVRRPGTKVRARSGYVGDEDRR